MALRLSTSMRRGVALLLVLAMIVLIVPVAAGFAQRAALAHLEQSAGVESRIANSIRAQIEIGPLHHWLESAASQVVIDLQAPTPRVEVLREDWRIDGCAYEVRVTAWDQCGMAPLGAITAGSPLRASIPDGILDLVNAAGRILSESRPAGLDQLGGDPFGSGHSNLRSAFPSPDEVDVHSLGAWIATHPVCESGSINVNTAPLPLVEAAMAAAGRGGIELIVAARREGRLAPLPRALEHGKQGTESSGALRLVGSSTSWAARIDVRVGAVRRSWWTVFRQTSGRWECVQRCVIPD